MNAHWVDNVRPSVRMIQLKNRWTDFDEIWYGLYANEAYPIHTIFITVQSIIPTWRAKATATQQGHTMMYGNRPSKNIQL